MEKTKDPGFRETWRNFRRGLGLLRPYAPGLYGAMIALAVIQAATPYVTVFFSAQVLSELALRRRPEVLAGWAAATVAAEALLALLRAAAAHRRNARYSHFAFNRDRIYLDKLLTMDFEVMEKRETRDLYAQIQQNAQWAGLGLFQLPELFETLLRDAIGVLSAVALCAGLFLSRVPASAGALTALDGPLGLLGLAAGVLIPTILGPWLLGRALILSRGPTVSEEARLGNRIFGAFGFLFYDSFRALDVRMYEQQVIARKHMKERKTFSADGPLAALEATVSGPLSGLAEGLSAIATGAVYLYVCLKAWAGAFGVGPAAQYIGAATALTGNLRGLLDTYSQMRHSLLYVDLSFAFLDIPNAMYQGSLTTEKRADRQYDVEFRDVSFRYPGTDAWALRHVDLKFRVGKRLAVVGENGSGKTTFIKLLCRLYDPQEGQILLNGIDIRKYDLQDYMAIFSVVFQDFQLLSQPLGANVAGTADYDPVRAEKALTDAGFSDRLAELSEGLDTQLYRDFDGEGVLLSGGEAQKVAIARALYKNAPFIVLDEPTAALDPMAEAEIYSKFNDIAGDRTAVYISHRLSSCRFCDEILVFDHGRIVQRGTHDALLETEGKYRSLWHAQAQYYEERQ